jgi:3',5'-cyclic AMP phosphodiesterase CpdA
MRGKRRLGYLSWWRKRRFELTATALARVSAAAVTEQADFIAITGDLVHLALAEELEQARAWLAELGRDHLLALVPGNHDCYGDDALSAMPAAWAPYLALGDGHDTAYPRLLRRGALSVIGLNSARPMPWWSAGGALGDEQLARLDAVLATTAGSFRCVLLHHPPLAGQAPARKALSDAAPLRALLAHHGVELVLHGHLHHNDVRLFGARARVVVTGPASSALRRNPASYRVIDVAQVGADWQVDIALKRVLPDGVWLPAESLQWRVPRL